MTKSLKLTLIIVISIAFLLIIMAITNPTKDEYISWVKEQAFFQSNSAIEQGVIALLGQPILDSSTATHNYIFFSIFETKIDSTDTKTIGIFKNFINVRNSTRLTYNTNDNQATNSLMPQTQSNNKESSFNGQYPQNVLAGVPFDFNFKISNPYTIPIIAAKIEFQNNSMIDNLTPDTNWNYDNGTIFTLPNLNTQNIYIDNNSSLNSKFTIKIDNPGTYQLKINPSVQAGEWKSLGEYYATFIVSDTPAAKQKRQAESDIQNLDSEIGKLNDNIGTNKDGISSLDNEISDSTERIKDLQNQIKDNQNQIKDDPQTADYMNNLISENQSEIDSLNASITDDKNKRDKISETINSLSNQVQNLLNQKQQLEASIQ